MAEGAEAAQEREEEEEVIETRGGCDGDWYMGVECGAHMPKCWAKGCKLQCKWNCHGGWQHVTLFQPCLRLPRHM